MNAPLDPCILDSRADPAPRHATVGVMVGHVQVGGGAPIVVQSMTNTDTADIDGTVAQVAALARSGSEIVRITVDRDEAAAAVPHIKDKLLTRGVSVPLVGDFHYIGHTLLADHPACAEALDKYRINPGNVGFGGKKDRQFSAIVELAAQAQQSRPDRCQLGVTRCGPADRADGHQCQIDAAGFGTRCNAGSNGPLGASVSRNGRKSWDWPGTESFCRPKSRRCRISSLSTARSPAVPSMPFIWG